MIAKHQSLYINGDLIEIAAIRTRNYRSFSDYVRALIRHDGAHPADHDILTHIAKLSPQEIDLFDARLLRRLKE